MKKPTFAQYNRIHRFLSTDRGLSRRLGPPSVNVCRANRSAVAFPAESVQVTDAIAAAGYDINSLIKVDILTFAHRYFNQLPLGAAAPAPAPSRPVVQQHFEAGDPVPGGFVRIKRNKAVPVSAPLPTLRYRCCLCPDRVVATKAELRLHALRAHRDELVIVMNPYFCVSSEKATPELAPYRPIPVRPPRLTVPVRASKPTILQRFVAFITRQAGAGGAL